MKKIKIDNTRQKNTQKKPDLSFIYQDNLSVNNAWLDELVEDAVSPEGSETEDNELISDFFNQSFGSSIFRYIAK